MDVNALNYCRFSLLLQPASAQFSESNEALIALPNLVESSLVRITDESNIVIFSHLLQHPQADIWALPSRRRVHAAIGNDSTLSSPMDILSSDGRGSTKTGADFSQAYFKTSLFILACRSDHVHASVYCLCHCSTTFQL
jgi:ASTRA-associated protein 1